MITTPDKRFEDIRPYNDSEIPAAMERLAANPLLDQVSAWLFPGKPVEEFRNMLLSVKTNRELQELVMYPVTMSIIEKTTKGLTWEGESFIRRTENTIHLNHRDIMLDAPFQQHTTQSEDSYSEISFGSNLMESLSCWTWANPTKCIRFSEIRGRVNWSKIPGICPIIC